MVINCGRRFSTSGRDQSFAVQVQEISQLGLLKESNLAHSTLEFKRYLCVKSFPQLT